MRSKLTLAVLAATTAGVLTACSGADQSAQHESGPTQHTSTSVSRAGHSSNGGETGDRDQKTDKNDTGKGEIGKAEAGKIATGKYGGRVLEVESDHAKGQPSWEVEIAGSHEGRIEVDVAKHGGRILEMEHD